MAKSNRTRSATTSKATRKIYVLKLTPADMRILFVSLEARAKLLEKHRWIDSGVGSNAQKMAAKLYQISQMARMATEAH